MIRSTWFNTNCQRHECKSTKKKSKTPKGFQKKIFRANLTSGAMPPPEQNHTHSPPPLQALVALLRNTTGAGEPEGRSFELGQTRLTCRLQLCRRWNWKGESEREEWKLERKKIVSKLQYFCPPPSPFPISSLFQASVFVSIASTSYV